MLKVFLLSLFAYAAFAQSIDNLKQVNKVEFANAGKFAVIKKADFTHLDKSGFSKSAALLNSDSNLLESEGNEITSLTELKTASKNNLSGRINNISTVKKSDFETKDKSGFTRSLKCPNDQKAIF